MRVIKRGRWIEPTEWEAQVACSRCESVLAVGLDDLLYMAAFSDQREPHATKSARCDIECVVCGHRQAVETPDHVRLAAKKLAAAREAATSRAYYDR